LPANTYAAGLTVVLGTELLGASVGDALERAAVLVFGAVRVVAAIREATLIGARSARPSDALLGFGARTIETCDEAFAIDANAFVSTLEIELTAEWRRVGFLFERIQAETVVRASRANWTVVRFLAFAGAAKRRAKLTDRAVGVGLAEISLRRGLRVAFVPPAQKTTALAQGPVGDAEIAGVPVTAGDSE
jgi:hypothetical protein